MEGHLDCDAIQIASDGPDGEGVAALLAEHLAEMRAQSPADGVHALPAAALAGPGVTFWTARAGGALLGCAALQELGPEHGEIKSMRTARAHRRRGVAARLLAHLFDEARARGYRRLSLETGATADFAPARALYERFGFHSCGPFGSYEDNGFSAFMTCTLPEPGCTP